jgi:uncharacterized membrane protein
MHRSILTLQDGLRLAAILLIVIYLIPTGAHLFELPNKIGLPAAQYMTVQRIYSGWALFGTVIAPALVLAALSALTVRGERPAWHLAVLALICLLGTQIVFWFFTYPVNVASANWTRMPDHFENARRHWEYSHAASAILTFAALVALTLSAFVDVRGRADTVHPSAG